MAEFDVLSVENQEAIEELAWTLQSSRGEFLLLIARCNYGQLRDRAIAALQERVPNIALWRVPEETETLLDGIQGAASSVVGGAAAVMVTGLGGVRDVEAVLGATNRIREEFRSRCPYPVVLWLTDVGLRSLMRYAPDFESWGTTTRFEMSSQALTEWLERQVQNWFTGERPEPIPSQAYWLELEQEFLVTEAWAKANQVQFRDEVQACRDGILGSIYLHQWKLDKSIEFCQRSLASWEEDEWPEGRAKVMVKLINAAYGKVVDQRDKSHPNWSKLQEITEQYFAFCKTHSLGISADDILGNIGEVLVCLQKWDILAGFAELSSHILEGEAEQGKPLAARPHAFLAEIAVAKHDWQTAICHASKALEIIDLLHESRQPSSRVQGCRGRR